MYLYIIQVPFCEEKVFNYSELHFSKVTSYKIHILAYSRHPSFDFFFHYYYFDKEILKKSGSFGVQNWLLGCPE